LSAHVVWCPELPHRDSVLVGQGDAAGELEVLAEVDALLAP